MNIYFWYTCYVFLKIVGLAPLSWPQKTAAKTLFKISAKARIYGVLLLILHILLHLCLLTHASLLKFPNHNVFFIIDIFFVVISFLVVVVTYTTFALRPKVIGNICDELYEINQSLKIFDENYWRKKIDTKFKLFVVLNCLFCAGFSVIAVIVKPPPWIYLTIFNSTLASCIVIQYVWMVALMGTMVELVNNQFQCFQKNSEHTVEIVKRKVNSQNTLATIEVLQEIYLKLTKTSSKYVEFYSFIIFTCIIRIFYSIVIELFGVIDNIVNIKLSPVSLTVLGLLLMSFWDCILLLSVTFSVTMLTNQVIISIWYIVK